MESLSITKEVKELNTSLKQKMFELGKKHGIDSPPSPLQVHILVYLEEHRSEVVTQNTLEGSFKISASAISEVLNKMEKNKLISRVTCETDARKKRIISTKLGKNRVREMSNGFKEMEEFLSSFLTYEEKVEFIRISEKIKENVRKESNNV